MRALTDQNLYSQEYRGGPLHYLHLDEDDEHSSCLDSPDEPVGLTEHLNTLELHGPWHLENAPAVFLSVVADGFYYTWDGRHEKHGPSEVYETETFDLTQLDAFRRLCQVVSVLRFQPQIYTKRSISMQAKYD